MDFSTFIMAGRVADNIPMFIITSVGAEYDAARVTERDIIEVKNCMTHWHSALPHEHALIDFTITFDILNNSICKYSWLF